MHLLFYATDAEAAKEEAAKGREAGASVRIVDVYACHEVEPCEGVNFMADVPEFEKARIEALFAKPEPGSDGETEPEPRRRKRAAE